MNRSRKLCSFLVCLTVLYSLSVLTGCGDLVPVWLQSNTLNDYTLENTSPCSFDVSIEKGTSITAWLELDITYDTGINRSRLPLKIALKEAGKDEYTAVYESIIDLKIEGEWMGIPLENEIDYMISHKAIPAITLEPQRRYILEVYSNDPESGSVYGIIKISARLYEIQKR